MDNNLENKDWKDEAPTLAALPLQHAFSVPEGYFERLPIQITNVIYLDKLKEKAAETGFNAPDHYFEELNQQIHSEILAERLKAIAPVKEYAPVSAVYFEELSASIRAKTIGAPQKQPNKIVRLWQSSLLKYASAACFVIVSATGLYFYQQQAQHNTKLAYAEMPTEQMLYDIDEQVIIEHIEANDLHQTKPAATDVALENYILNNYTQSDIASDL